MTTKAQEDTREELRGLQDTVNALRLRCTMLETTNQAVESRCNDADQIKLQLSAAYAMLSAKETEMSRSVAEASALHEENKKKTQTVEAKTREILGLEATVQKLTMVQNAKDREMVALRATMEESCLATDASAREAHALHVVIRNLTSLQSEKDSEVTTLQSMVVALQEENQKRQREHDAHVSPAIAKRRCVSADKIFTLTGFGDPASIGSIVTSLSVIRTAQPDGDAFLSLVSDDIVADNVTHVIVPNDNGKSTMKLLSGLVKGKWIVPVAYVTACLQAKNWLDERDFGVRYETLPLQGKRCFVGVSDRHVQPATTIIQCGGGEIVDSTLRADVAIKDWGLFTNALIKGKFAF